MEKYSGKSVVKGIAIGRIYLYKKTDYRVTDQKVSDCEAEKARFLAAVETAKEQLAGLYREALEKVGEDHARIFEVHRMLLEDTAYLDAVQVLIRGGYNAVYATDRAGAQFADMFAGMDDEYMRGRAVDIRDISRRVIRVLSGLPEEGIRLEESAVLVADDLTPTETVKLDRSRILGFVTVKGSSSSHTAILARSMNLPALVGVKLPLADELQGKPCVVDGFAGVFLVEPTKEDLARMLVQKNQWTADLEALQRLKGKDNRTKSGKRIEILANIGDTADADAALAADAGGIGLFRSEFLYLGRDSFPTEEEQFASYRAVLEKMEGKRVVVRTMDIGADKKADYFHFEPEENPAMGYRGVRVCLDRVEIFITQLRALYRASSYGDLAVMFPMIISVDEVRRIRQITEMVRKDLEQEGTPVGKVLLGVMIETPAAALVSDKLAREADFFSIGTNDLAQYTLAADRMNRRLEGICDPRHEAVLRLIEMTVKNAHEAGIHVGICGELASDMLLLERFLEWGVDELSVVPSDVLKLREAVRALP
ncbi:MAG: phosphoenolpyruvate--protein phosphotransferase [Lachnospiraceae bacterium]|nr:phosphoenolpyruvate--protein phosphotransferase [Lachnospiraceae bacterium]